MNSFKAQRGFAERMQRNYPPGTRVVLNHMNDPQAVPDGTRGTVTYVDDAGQLGMKWDNGRGLSLIPGEDDFRKLTPEESAEEQNRTETEDFSMKMQ